ncbi:sensor domain-containing protein [Streptomyces similanensis]|uniref:Sensor domain-containing protein n=1 Tax=Streptomyces similanensis TaxID=1274988 RepID=A0ABP9L6T5_9ACTN
MTTAPAPASTSAPAPESTSTPASTSPVRDSAAVRVRRVLREPFTAAAWRRVAYAVLALPTGVLCVPFALVSRRAGRLQRGLLRRFLGVELPGNRRGLLHALLATPVNLLVVAVTLYGWSVVPMNLGWPLRVGSDYADSWGGPTFAGAWAFHAAVGGGGFALLMPWLGRAMAALQVRIARALLS